MRGILAEQLLFTIVDKTGSNPIINIYFSKIMLLQNIEKTKREREREREREIEIERES